MLESLVKVKVLKCMPSIFSPIKLLVLRFPCASNVLPMPPTYQNLDCILKIRPIFVHQNFCKMKYSFPPHKKNFHLLNKIFIPFYIYYITKYNYQYKPQSCSYDLNILVYPRFITLHRTGWYKVHNFFHFVNMKFEKFHYAPERLRN